MEFEYSLTIPAGTAKADAVSVDCQLSKGIIHRYSVAFLEGCNNLVSVAVFEGGWQCFPLNPDGAIKGNAEAVEKETFYPLESPPYKLKVKGWAPTASYAHTVLLRFDVLPREYFENLQGIQDVITAVSRELQLQYAQTTEGLAEKLGDITKMITPAPMEPAELPEETGAEPPEPEEKAIDKLTKGQLIAVRAQIQRGWSMGQIIDANWSWIKLSEAEWAAVLQEIRASI